MLVSGLKTKTQWSSPFLSLLVSQRFDRLDWGSPEVVPPQLYQSM